MLSRSSSRLPSSRSGQYFGKAYISACQESGQKLFCLSAEIFVDRRLLGASLGVSLKPCERRHGVLCVLLLLRVELRRRKSVCAGLQAADRLAGLFPSLPVVEYRNGCMVSFQSLAQEDRPEPLAAL